MAHYDPLHPAPPSPNPNMQQFSQHQFNPEAQPLHSQDYGYPQGDIPPGAAPPRFYQLSDEGPLQNPAPLGNFGEPQPRDSIVSYGTGSPYNRDSAFAPGPSTPGGSTTFLGAGAPGGYRDDGFGSTTNFHSSTSVPMSPLGKSRGLDKEELYAPPSKKKSNALFKCGVALLVIILIAIGVLIPVYFKIIKPNSLLGGSNGNGTTDGGNGGSSGGNGGNGGNGNQDPITGGDGSTVKLTEGGTMTYVNKFGGFWVEDPSNPFDNSARPNSWTKPLNESWDYSNDKIWGVNLGGWLNTEPFISPALFEKYNVNGQIVAVDEWTLSQQMAQDTAGGGLQALMEEHYKTFITEKDFAAIAAAGLNWIRIPIPFWAIEVWDDEPFLPRVCWSYFLKAIKWARKYGLRINLDLHAVPGSQNSWNHSGRLGHGPNFMNGVMGVANAQRTLNYIRILTEFISQPQYKDVIPFFGIINEALVGTIGQPQIGAFYLEAYNMIRNITGVGEGNGPLISIHDGFMGLNQWNGFLEGADRIGLDTHPYLAFNGVGNDPMAEQVLKPCLAWASNMNNSMNSGLGFTAAGEWSNAINDCGLNVNGVGLGTRYEGTFRGFEGRGAGSCDVWNDYKNWDSATREGIRQFNLASMDALQNWFFWTWRIGNSSVSGDIESPFWSYELGLREGWITPDPRTAMGTCLKQGLPSNPFTAPLKAWQTGGAGAGTIAAAQLASYGTWPPATISNANPPYATYTATGTISTMPAPTYTHVSGKTTSTFDAGNGWFNTADTAPAYTAVSGCTYAPAWDAIASPLAMTCANQRRWPAPTPAPRP